MRFGNECRNHADLDFACLIGLDRGEKLDAVVQLIREADISCGDFFNPFDKHIGRFDPKSIRQRGKNDGLVSGVPTIHVQRGIGLGVAQSLRIREHRCKISALLRHASKDVVAGAIEDSMNGLKTISHEGLADRLNDRYAASHSRLIKNRHMLFVGKFKNLATMLS